VRGWRAGSMDCGMWRVACGVWWLAGCVCANVGPMQLGDGASRELSVAKRKAEEGGFTGTWRGVLSVGVRLFGLVESETTIPISSFACFVFGRMGKNRRVALRSTTSQNKRVTGLKWWGRKLARLHRGWLGSRPPAALSSLLVFCATTLPHHHSHHDDLF